jgi:hypothetical protein
MVAHMPPIPIDPNVALRKVYFQKVLPRTGDPADFEFDRAAIVNGIEALRGAPDFYLQDGPEADEQFLCAAVDRTRTPQRFRFYRVRRRNLPETEAAGDFAALELEERSGLAESIHVVLFPDGVVGSEYNHYGPRATTLASFFKERLDQDVVLWQLVRKNVMSEILALREIRKIRIKASPAAAAALQGRASGLGGAFESAERFSAGKYLDLTLAPEPGDQQFTQRVKAFVRGLRDDEARSHLQAAQVYGLSEDGLYEALDLLHDYVVLNREIERESPRSRALDKDAAYRAVENAHREIQDDLAEGGTIAVEA